MATKNLVIVESPTKAKTISKFLGNEYIVKSCYGHIRDLAPDKLSVDVEKKFKPDYQIPADKKKLVSELKKLAKEAELIWLATDEDREGEAISWHLKEALKLNENNTRRIVFHEITKKAIDRAIQNPRSIDQNLVEAQQARRILDRLVGFELSPVLWKKVKPSLSAGRVQSVAVRLIVERERDIINFKPEDTYRINALFTFNGNGKQAELKAELPERFKKEEQARKFLEQCAGAGFNIAEIEVKPGSKSPAPPFTTSTLQQEASRKLGFSVSKTMTMAQKLYEEGHITYMRTDSVNLADDAIKAATDQVVKNYGERYSKTRKYATKSKGAQEAHEAIRPSYFNKQEAGGSRDEKRLYDLIWKRAIASQMANAILEKTTVKINNTGNEKQFQANGEVLKFDGFLKVYMEGRDEEDEESGSSGMLPPIKEGQELQLKELIATQRFSRPAARYTEASLVRKMEELGIGRPSTYAPTISTIQKRGYVERESREGEERNFKVLSLVQDQVKEDVKTEIFGAEKAKLFPTNTGIMVNDFLIANFQNIMDYNFTAKVEKEFDEIAQGDKEWDDMLDKFYGPFHHLVDTTTKEKARASNYEYGVDPESGKNVYGKIGRYGPYVQLGEKEDDEKPKFAKLRPGQLLETLTLVEAMTLFEMPRNLGDFEGEEMVVDIGRFGPYIRHMGNFYSLPKEEDPYQVNAERAKEIVAEKREQKEKKTIHIFKHEDKEIKILRGPYGPYISIGRTNVKIPKDQKPEELTLERALELIQDYKDNPPKARKGGRKKPAK